MWSVSCQKKFEKENNMKYMRQCKLKSGNAYTVGWIEECLAVLGKRVTFEKSQDGVIWRVCEVYSRLPKQYVEDLEREHLSLAKKYK